MPCTLTPHQTAGEAREGAFTTRNGPTAHNDKAYALARPTGP
jgi:hypothetical protein